MRSSTKGGSGGDGLGRLLLGVTGVVIAAGGLAVALLAVLVQPFPYASAAGVFLVSTGMILVVVCAFYDDVEIATGGPTILKIKVSRRRDSE